MGAGRDRQDPHSDTLAMRTDLSKLQFAQVLDHPSLSAFSKQCGEDRLRKYTESLAKSKGSVSVDIAIMIILLFYKGPSVALGMPGTALTPQSEITEHVSMILSICHFKNNCRLEE